MSTDTWSLVNIASSERLPFLHALNVLPEHVLWQLFSLCHSYLLICILSFITWGHFQTTKAATSRQQRNHQTPTPLRYLSKVDCHAKVESYRNTKFESFYRIVHLALVMAGNTKKGKTVEWVYLSRTGLGYYCEKDLTLDKRPLWNKTH